MDPATLGNDHHLADPEFEKEAWLSMVMLEWGSCGQVATAIPDERSDAEPPCLGYVFYAPPRAVPRAHRFPTAPVSADAVLLTSMGIERGQAPDDLPHSLIAGVVDELVRRGVRALEAFGRTVEVADLQDPGLIDPEVRPVLEVVGDCSVDHCVIDADFLTDMGFVVVAPHRYFPRLRLELDKGFGWKAEVEAALERLLENAQLQQPVGRLRRPVLLLVPAPVLAPREGRSSRSGQLGGSGCGPVVARLAPGRATGEICRDLLVALGLTRQHARRPR
ncbi:putative acetyltransferase [Mycobacterium kansasii 824]|nr:putative acetyltransferase [Mycobacterium kansasii 824]